MLHRLLLRLGLVPAPCSHEFTVTDRSRSMADDGEVMLTNNVRCACGWVGTGEVATGITVPADRGQVVARA